MLEISLLGQVAMRVDGRELSGVRGKPRQVLAILALHAGTPVSKERLADLLWEGNPPASYVSTLDSYVCVLRRQLGLSAGRRSQLATTDVGFRLDISADVQTDLFVFRALARSTEDAANADVVDRAEQAMALITGDLVSDVPYAEWAVRARDAFSREVVELCLRGAQRANALGESERAQRLARAAVEHDAVCEDAWRQLMLAHWFAGQRGAAIAAYGELREVMAERLGGEPGQDSQQLYLTILRDTSEAGPSPVDDQRSELRLLLRLLRQALDSTPGVRAPARDGALSEVAMMALAGAC
ncbi:MAG TPA: BTAD domain-containing putative transcriptional regulator [Nocardioidaceae bacterium]|nr:BTAD domain-containing putative transcriptional regulator [Nocardioidaceae bacterium]